jgi:hypothetical protein
MRELILIIFFVGLTSFLYSQETLQTVTDRGNTTSNGINVTGESSLHGVTFKTVDTYYKELRPEGFNFIIKNGAGDGQISIPYNSLQGNIRFYNFGLNVDKYIGIKTLNPTTGLQLGDIGAEILGKQILIPGVYNFEQIRLGQIGNGNMAMEFINHTSLNQSYGIRWLVDVDRGASGLQLQYANQANSYNELNYTTGFYMSRYDGYIGMGTTNPTEKLSVNGKIRAKEIKVEVANWPDYVFDEDYELPGLENTEEYIRKNKHLPGIPPSKEVEEEGVSLGEMNMKLLRKIEELTLYILEQNKINQQQEERIKQLEINYRNS